jgi:hypothetical protein
VVVVVELVTCILPMVVVLRDLVEVEYVLLHIKVQH